MLQRAEDAMNIKRNGCCTLCDEPVFEVIDRFPSSHLRAGHPRSLGAALEGATRVSLLLTDGSSTTLSFCARCAPEIGSRLVEIWRKCLATMAYHHNNIAEIKERPATNEEIAASEADVVWLASLVPLGVIETLPWAAFDDRLRM